MKYLILVLTENIFKIILPAEILIAHAKPKIDSNFSCRIFIEHFKPVFNLN